MRMEVVLTTEAILSGVLRHWLAGYEGLLPEVYIVGGVVRDLLLSRTPKDVDLVCKNAESLARQLAGARDAVVVPLEKKADEPCYRVVDRTNPEMSIDITELRGRNILEDLGRRDFTINAMAIKVKKGGALGDAIDPYQGAQDLERGIVRATGPDSFISDPLRILRAIRFAAKFDFEIDARTLAEMERTAGSIREVSAERIVSELLQILTTPRCAHSFRQMDRLGVLEVIFPEIGPMKGCTQNSFHHKDVWQHSLAVLENCETILNHLPEFLGDSSDAVLEDLEHHDRLALLKLAALLHDVGKPGVRQIDAQTGRITFYGHDQEGAGTVDRAARRLKVSNRARTFLCLLVAEHLHVLKLSEPEVKKSTRMRWFRKLKDKMLLDDAVPIIILGMADIKGTLGVDSSEEDRTGHLEWSKRVIGEYFSAIKPELERKDLITGSDLLGLGMKPGPQMGVILKRIREARDEGEIHDREGALRKAKALLAETSQREQTP
jgi:poly(A) polymerase